MKTIERLKHIQVDIHDVRHATMSMDFSCPEEITNRLIELIGIVQELANVMEDVITERTCEDER